MMRFRTVTLALTLIIEGSKLNSQICVPSPSRERGKVNCRKATREGILGCRVGVQCPLVIQTFNPLLLSFWIGLFIASVVISPLHAASNDNFGRLFSSQAERNKLDNLRQNQQLKVIAPQGNSTSEDGAVAEPAELPDAITMQGYVKRSDGAKSTLWINNQAVQEEATVNNVQVGRLNKRGFSSKGASTEGVDVKIANGKQVRLKAGQMYEPETNQIIEMQVVEKAKRLNLEETGVIDDAQLSASRAGKIE